MTVQGSAQSSPVRAQRRDVEERTVRQKNAEEIGTRVVYEGVDDGTVYTDKKASISNARRVTHNKVSVRMVGRIIVLSLITYVQSYPNANSARGSYLPALVGGFWK